MKKSIEDENMAKIAIYGQILLKNDIKSSISTWRKPKFAFFEVGAVFPTLNYPRNIETEVPDIAQYLALEWLDGRTDGRTDGHF